MSPFLSIHKLNLGYCPICAKRTLFVARGKYLREHYRCVRCRSLPRYRALVQVLETHFPKWRNLSIHESSPYGPASDKIRRECLTYIGTQYDPDLEPGDSSRGFRNEDLGKVTFGDEVFDMVITQDVLEHVLHPEAALKEIARTLKPGGAHVFTVPWNFPQETVVRASEVDGKLVNHLPPDFHGHPFKAEGSLVITEWGRSLVDVIYESTGMTTIAMRLHDVYRGIEAQFIEVFISYKRKNAA